MRPRREGSVGPGDAVSDPMNRLKRDSAARQVEARASDSDFHRSKSHSDGLGLQR